MYYTREGGIPQAEAARLIQARSKDERAALAVVLEEFFVLRGGLYVQDRSEREIQKYKEKSEKARRSALAGVEARRDKADMTNRELRAARMAASRQKGRHTDEEWHLLREFCGEKCVKCGSEGHQDRDHIVPVYQGGSDGIENIQPLCARCNSAKGPDSADHRPSGWAEFLDKSLTERSANAQRTLSERLAPSNQTPVTKEKEARVPALTVADLAADGLSENLAVEFLAHRKRKRALLTARAWSTIKSEAGKAGLSPAAVAERCIARGWVGFEAEWVKPVPNGAASPPIPRTKTLEEVGL